MSAFSAASLLHCHWQNDLSLKSRDGAWYVDLVKRQTKKNAEKQLTSPLQNFAVSM